MTVIIDMRFSFGKVTPHCTPSFLLVGNSEGQGSEVRQDRE